MNEFSPERKGLADESGEALRAAVARELEGARPAQERVVPPPIPDHTLVKRIGIGAYGEVWLARSALGTARAIKIVYRDGFEDDRPYQREFNGILKYEPVSRTHEGLTAVLHVGRNDEAGCFYYVMELADNAMAGEAQALREPGSGSYKPRTLRSELARLRRMPPSAAARLAIRLAGALEHLHSRGLVHRDVKPSNIIFVEGKPKLADVGLITGTGSSRSFVGTEGFIPPEGPGSPQADLYGLGKLLYELATGGDRMDFPLLPPDLIASPDGEAVLELNEVITRACAPIPAQRYATAAELVTDLNLFLSGQSLRRVRKTERHLARLKRLAAAAGLTLALSAAALWLTRVQERRAREREQSARALAHEEAVLRARAEAAEQQTRRQLYSALLEQARATVRSGELGQRVNTLDAIRRAAAITNTSELRSEALAALALPDLRFEREWLTGPEFTIALLDPTFERIALSRGPGPVEIRSVREKSLLALLPGNGNLIARLAEWSPDGKFLAVRRDRPGDQDRADLEVWDLEGPRRVLLHLDVDKGALSFHPSAPIAIAGLRAGTVTVNHLVDGIELSRFKLASPPNQLKFSPQGDRFAAAYARTPGWTVAVYRISDGEQLASHHFGDLVASVGWHPAGQQVAVADAKGLVHLMDTRSGEVHTLGRHKAQAVWTTFSPDGLYLLSGGWEREIICWDLRTLHEAFGIGLDAFVTQFNVDGKRLAVTARSAIQLHTFERSAVCREFPEDLGGRLRRAAFSADGRWLAVPGAERLGVWDLTSNGPAALLTEGADSRISFSSQGPELFTCCDDGCCRWQVTPATNPETPPQLEQVALGKPAGMVSICVVSNEAVITCTQGSQLVAVDKLPVLGEHWTPTEWGVTKASPDGRWLAVYRPFSQLLFVYSLPALQQVAVLTNRASIGGTEFLPKGNELAVASRGRVEFWNTTTWERTHSMNDSMGIISAPDGQTWWLTQDYRTAGLYDAHTLKLLLPLPKGTLPLALSPDGRYLAASVDARRLQLWNLVVMRQCLRELGNDWEGP